MAGGVGRWARADEMPQNPGDQYARRRLEDCLAIDHEEQEVRSPTMASLHGLVPGESVVHDAAGCSGSGASRFASAQ